MSTFENVTIVKKANVYFDGKVTSRTVLFADGSKKTLGFMLPGDYEFGTDTAERMDILAGKLRIKLPGDADWCAVSGGEAFEVPANAKFQLQIIEATDYCCSYF
ncbi:MAG: pyrimidine/purine nucleoside phosphorylase [Porticoccaceae bacterium]